MPRFLASSQALKLAQTDSIPDAAKLVFRPERPTRDQAEAEQCEYDDEKALAKSLSDRGLTIYSVTKARVDGSRHPAEPTWPDVHLIYVTCPSISRPWLAGYVSKSVFKIKSRSV